MSLIVKNPKIWGPDLWHILHFLTFVYNSKEDREIYRELFLRCVPIFIPCPPCRRHYLNRLIRIPINLNSRQNLSRWLINLHNDVNKSLKKEYFSYEKALKIYRPNKTNKEKVKKSFVRYSNISRGYISTSSEVQKANSKLVRILMKHI